MAKKKITKLYPRDQKALMSISRCGHVSEEHLLSIIANKRINGYLKDGLIEKDVVNKLNGEHFTGYKLTKSGRTLVEKEYGFKEHQIAQSVPHDNAISDKYFSLTDSQRDTWKTETQLRNEFNERLEELRERDYIKYNKISNMQENKEISVTDASYVETTGVTVTYEVETNNYGQAEINAKTEFSRFMELKLEERRV